MVINGLSAELVRQTLLPFKVLQDALKLASDQKKSLGVGHRPIPRWGTDRPCRSPGLAPPLLNPKYATWPNGKYATAFIHRHIH